ncbi:DEAD/DEAH box helicase [Micromonospora sp. BRA006-A]|uniref:DEAD/DEAH box helicase n=1 Tax=Micromonospora sp. BRA006-A TaxID=2962860 RepID=UPI00296E87A9|nr:DEAD/DEAH box helicase [Micromonospora sp. BRA006-A]MDW3849677.1 DEAD/DEAH box helicase [Micromonospora sp. BRA006-A]
MTAPLTLRPYQREAVEAVRDHWARGIRRQLIVLPTGAGKTVVFSHLIRRRAQAGRALVIAHRDELIRQAVEKIQLVAPDLRVGVVQANRNEHEDAQVIVASIQTLSREHRIAPLVGTIATIIVDEAHHAAARTYLDALRTLGSFDPDGPLTVGVTATAGRADGVALGSAWQEIVYQRGILQMIVDGHLVDVRGMEVTTDLDYGTVSTSRGDFTDGSLGQAMEDSHAIEASAIAYQKYAADRSGVAFTPTIATAESLAGHLNQRGITAEHLSGLTPRDERAAILGRLHTGETQVVTNAQVLTEGFDEPRVGCVLVARPTTSATLFIQMVGRGLRLYPGKKDCLALTLAGPPGSGLATIATLAGKQDGPKVEPKPGESLAEAAVRLDAEDAERRQLVGSAVRGKAVAMFGRSGLSWVPVDDSFVLSCGDAALIVRPAGEPDRWRAINVPRAGAPAILGDKLTLEYAQGVAEEFARGTRAKLARADAPWRARPVSAAQRRLLDSLRLGPAATSGEASDLIAAHHARRALARITRNGVAA